MIAMGKRCYLLTLSHGGITYVGWVIQIIKIKCKNTCANIFEDLCLYQVKL